MKYLLLNKNYFKHKNKKEVYFHDWCLDKDWTKLSPKLFQQFERNRICKYHWENAKKYKKDYKFITKLTEKLLKEIVIDINKFHNLNYSKEYWKIILLPWLKQLLVLFYDRWEMVNQIPKKKLTFCIYNYKDINFVPEKFGDLNSQEKAFNYWIIGKIVEYKKNIKFVKKNIKSSKKYKFQISNKKKISKIYTFIFKFFSKIFKCDFFMYGMGFTKYENFFFNIKLSQFPFFWLDPTFENEKIDIEKRKQYFHKKTNKRSFENFIRKIMYLSIPKSYLENYNNINKAIDKSYWPKKSKLVLTSYAYYVNEVFKIWTARMVMKGSKYIILQHGGCMGLHELNMGEDVQLGVCHKILSWGWKDKMKKIIPFIALTLSMRKKKLHDIQTKNIFICVTLPNKFNVGIASYPRTNLEGLKKINSIKSLVNNLNANLSDKIILRYIKQLEERLLYKFQEEKFNKKIKYDHAEMPFNKVMHAGNLFIHDSNGTGFLETMFSNLPTIVLLDKKCETFRKTSRSLVKLLENKKIIHYNANSLANFINKNYNNIDKWWFNKNLQLVREKFCLKYAKQDNEPFTEFKNILEKLSKKVGD